MIAFDILRGAVFFVIVIVEIIVTAWMMLPIQDADRTIMGLAGGGALVALVFVMILSIVTVRIQ